MKAGPGRDDRSRGEALPAPTTAKCSYVAVALVSTAQSHAAQRQLRRLLPGEIERLEASEPAFVGALVRAALGPPAE